MSFLPEDAAHWFEIPVTDMARAKAFYGAVLENEPKDETYGQNPIAIFAYKGNGRVSGHLYPGKPAPAGTGPTVHLTVAQPLEAALERVQVHGGQVVSPVIEIPAGRFAYCLDPDGNSISLFT